MDAPLAALIDRCLKTDPGERPRDAGVVVQELKHRTSELAELPLWLIHVAWPVAGFTWIVFAGEQIVDEAKILFGRAP